MCTESDSTLKRWLCIYVQHENETEMNGAILMFTLGTWLLFNHTFQVSNVYKIMASIGSEWQWAAVFVTVAAIQLLSIFTKYEGKYISSFYVRKHVLLLKGGIWLILFVGVLQGDGRALSTPIYLIFALNAFRSFFCLRRN